MWEILTQRRPWEDLRGPFLLNKLLSHLQGGDRPPIPPDASESYVALMTRCWTTDPAHRPCFGTIVASPVFGALERSQGRVDATIVEE